MPRVTDVMDIGICNGCVNEARQLESSKQPPHPIYLQTVYPEPIGSIPVEKGNFCCGRSFLLYILRP